MICEKEIQITNKLGLHARAAAQFVKTANRFSADVEIKKEKLRVNGKSILGVLTLAASCNSVIAISCQGPDASEALEALEGLIKNNFYEE